MWRIFCLTIITEVLNELHLWFVPFHIVNNNKKASYFVNFYCDFCRIQNSDINFLYEIATDIICARVGFWWFDERYILVKEIPLGNIILSLYLFCFYNFSLEQFFLYLPKVLRRYHIQINEIITKYLHIYFNALKLHIRNNNSIFMRRKLCF